MLSSWAAALKLSCSATAQNVRSWCSVSALSSARVSAIAESGSTIGQVTEEGPAPPSPSASEQKLNQYRGRRAQAVRPDAAAGAGNDARERIEALVDPGSFAEVDLFAPGDGVVVGIGAIDARDVALYAFEPSEPGGSPGEVTAEKIVKVQELALRTR